MYVVTRPRGNRANGIIAIANYLLPPEIVEGLIALDELSELVLRKAKEAPMTQIGLGNHEKIRTDWLQGQVCPHCGHDKLDEVGMCGSCRYDAELGHSSVQLPTPKTLTVVNVCRDCDGCPSKNPNLCPHKRRDLH